MRLYLSSESQSPLTSSRQKGSMGVDSPGSKMIGVSGASVFCSLYSGVLEGASRRWQSCSIRGCDDPGGVRPRFVAITVKLFSALLDGSTVIRTQGLSEWIRAWAFNKAAWALGGSGLCGGFRIARLAVNLFQQRKRQQDADVSQDGQQPLWPPM